MRLSFKKLLAPVLVLSLAMLLIAGCTTGIEKKMGVIDMNKVIKQSPKAQEYQNQLDEKATEIQAEYETIDKNADLSDEEKEKQKSTVLQKFVDLKADLEDKLNKDIQKAVDEVAEDKDLDIIFQKQSVQYGGVDVTDEVIEKLK